MYRIVRLFVVAVGCLMVAAAAHAISQPPGHFAYIINSRANTVSFIDTDTRTVTRTVLLPAGAGPRGVAVGATGFTLYVTNADNGTVSLISTTAGAILATIATGGNPTGIAVNNEETLAYVTDKSNDKVHIVDLLTRKVVKSVAVGDGPHGITVDPTGGYLYVTNKYDDTVSILTTSGIIAGTVTVGSNPWDVRVHPSGASIWVTNEFGSGISVINRYNWSVATITTGGRPGPICFNRAGTYAYAVDMFNDTVLVIKVATKAVVATIPVGQSLQGVSLDRSDRFLYVINYSDDNVFVIDTTTNTVVNTVAVGDGPSSLGQFINASTLWTSAATASMRVTYPEEDTRGNVKLKNKTQAIQGTCYLYATYWRPVRLYCDFSDDTYLDLTNMSHLSTENPKSKTETVNMNGTGTGGVYLPTNQFFPGFASFTDGKGTLKRAVVGGEVTSIVVNGKITIHGDTGVVGTATLRLTFSKP